MTENTYRVCFQDAKNVLNVVSGMIALKWNIMDCALNFSLKSTKGQRDVFIDVEHTEIHVTVGKESAQHSNTNNYM